MRSTSQYTRTIIWTRISVNLGLLHLQVSAETTVFCGGHLMEPQRSMMRARQTDPRCQSSCQSPSALRSMSSSKFIVSSVQKAGPTSCNRHTRAQLVCSGMVESKTASTQQAGERLPSEQQPSVTKRHLLSSGVAGVGLLLAGGVLAVRVLGAADNRCRVCIISTNL